MKGAAAPCRSARKLNVGLGVAPYPVSLLSLKLEHAPSPRDLPKERRNVGAAWHTHAMDDCMQFFALVGLFW